MSSDNLAVTHSQVNDLLTSGEVELTLRRLGRILPFIELNRSPVMITEVTNPFHAISGSDLAEFSEVTKDCDVCGVGEFGVVCGRTEIELASACRDLVELSNSERKPNSESSQQVELGHSRGVELDCCPTMWVKRRVEEDKSSTSSSNTMDGISSLFFGTKDAASCSRSVFNFIRNPCICTHERSRRISFRHE